MYPNKVIIHNLGLISGEFPLSPVTLITGDNRTGKTTILKALEMGLTGTVYDPEQGRFSTFDELTAEGVNNMRVRLIFDNGFWIDRKYIRTEGENGKGKVKVTQLLDFKDIPQDAIGKPRQAERALKIALNPSIYGLHITQIIEAKTTERRKILLNLLVGSDDARPLEEWIYSEAEEILSDDTGAVSSDDMERVESLSRDIVTASSKDIMILDRLFRINLDVAEKLKTAKGDLESTTSVIRNLGFDEAEKVDTSEIPELEKRIKGFEDEIEKLAENIGSAKTDTERSIALKIEISETKDKEKALGTVRNRDDIENDRTGLETEKETALDEAFQPFKDDAADILNKYNDAVSVVEVQVQEQRDIVSNLRGKVETEETRKRELKTEYGELVEKVDAFDDHLATSEDADSKCPLCTSIIDPQELIGLWNKDKDKKQSEIMIIEDSVNRLNTSIREAHNKIVKIEALKPGYSFRKQNDLDSLNEEKDKVLDAVQKDYDDKLKPLDDQIGICDDSDEFVKDRIKSEKELNEIQVTDYSDLELTLKSRKSSKQADSEKLEKLKNAERDAKRKTTLETEQLTQMREVRCLDAIKKVTGAQGIPGTLLKEKIDPFIKSVNDVLHRFAPDMDFNIEFQDDRGKESCQFGFKANEIWTLFESASGIEKRLILFAIVIALMNRETFVNQRVVMLDEISVADEKMAAILIEAAKIAVNNKLIDAAYLAGTLRDSDLEIVMTAHSDVFDKMIVCSPLGANV